MNISSLLSPDDSTGQQNPSSSTPTRTTGTPSPARSPRKNVARPGSGKRTASGLSQEILLEPEDHKGANTAASTLQTPNAENSTFNSTKSSHTPIPYPKARPISNSGAAPSLSSAKAPHHAFPSQNNAVAAPNFRRYHIPTSHPTPTASNAPYHQQAASPHPHQPYLHHPHHHRASPQTSHHEYVSAHAHPLHHHERPVITHRHSSATSMETLAGLYTPSSWRATRSLHICWS